VLERSCVFDFDLHMVLAYMCVKLAVAFDAQTVMKANSSANSPGTAPTTRMISIREYIPGEAIYIVSRSPKRHMWRQRVIDHDLGTPQPVP